MVDSELRSKTSITKFREHLSELSLEIRGLGNSNKNRKRDQRRGLLFERMEDRRLLAIIDLAALAPDQGSVLYGVDAGDNAGYVSNSAGDFNGDGYDDVVMGAPNGAGQDNLELTAGEAYVVFGGPNFPTSVDLSSLGSGGVTIYGADAGDRVGEFGMISSAGDVNGDEIDDLLLGARADGAGESYIIFGSRSLLEEIDLANLGSAGVTIYGAENGNAREVAGVGDVNDDGLNDVLIGARGVGPGQTGVAHVFYGRTSWDQTIDLAATAADVTIYGRGRSFGGTTSPAGDFNGDGTDDFMIGDSGVSGGGAVYVFLGSTSLPAVIDLTAPSTSAVITIEAANTDDQLGSRAISSAGDVNGDGKDDLLIGSTSEEEVDFVVYGSETPPATIDLANLGSAGIVLNGVRILWDGLASEDVNGDDYDDVIIGSRSKNGLAGLREGSGSTYVVFGGSDLPNSIELTELGDAGVTIYGAEAGDASGNTVGSAGDVNGDGFGDILIGAPGGDGIGNGKFGSGESYVIFGGDFSTTAPSLSIGDSDGTEGDQLMFTVSLSDASSNTVTVPFVTANGTAVAGSDYDSQVGTVTFLPGESLTQTVLIDTIDDSSTETDETFFVALGIPSGAVIGDGQGTGTIQDNDTGPSTKFYVVNNGGSDKTFEYAADGTSIESQPVSAANNKPRGVATTAAGDMLWVIDADKTVYVYDTSGNQLGSWVAKGPHNKAKLQGIATDGTDIWIVDDKANLVLRYAGAASRTEGNQSPTDDFALVKGNKKPRGITTDGQSIWVVNNGKKDKVFKYSVDGTSLGRWRITTPGASTPTGITLDPSGASQSLWIVDKGTDRVYEYPNTLNKTSGKLSTSLSFALAAGNTNPQGIADPPPVGNSLDATQLTAVAAASVMTPPSAGYRSTSIDLVRTSKDQPQELTRSEAHDQLLSRFAAQDIGTDRFQLPLASETRQLSLANVDETDDVFSTHEPFDAVDESLLGLLALQR